MTNPDQQGQSPDYYQPYQDAPQRTDRSSRSRGSNGSPRPRHKRARLWIGLAVVVLIGLGGALITLTTSGTNQTAANGSSGSVTSAGTVNPTGASSTVPKGTSKTKGKVISAAKLAQNGGALHLPADDQAQVASWQAGVGGRDLTAVSSQLGNALQAAGVRQYASMRYACTQLAANVAKAEAGPPIPDAAMQTLYAKALGELAKGAAGCQAAISAKQNGDESVQTHVDTTRLNRSISELSAGSTNLFRSTAEIEIASRQHK